MNELLEASQRVVDMWYTPRNNVTLQEQFTECRDAMAELRTEVTIQRNRIAADDIVERVEQP